MAKCLKTVFLQTASRGQHVSCVRVHIHILVSSRRIRQRKLVGNDHVVSLQ